MLLCDEASQYSDADWGRFFVSVKEQPHMPFCMMVADFQQLQPVGGGGMCKQFCEKMQTVRLETVYRTSDEAHLLFQNRIREGQPEKEVRGHAIVFRRSALVRGRLVLGCMRRVWYGAWQGA